MSDGVLLCLFFACLFFFLVYFVICLFSYMNFRTARDTLLDLVIHLFFRLIIHPFINSHMSPDSFRYMFN